jgi:hypothetical protein
VTRSPRHSRLLRTFAGQRRLLRAGPHRGRSASPSAQRCARSVLRRRGRQPTAPGPALQPHRRASAAAARARGRAHRRDPDVVRLRRGRDRRPALRKGRGVERRMVQGFEVRLLSQAPLLRLSPRLRLSRTSDKFARVESGRSNPAMCDERYDPRAGRSKPLLPGFVSTDLPIHAA